MAASYFNHSSYPPAPPPPPGTSSYGAYRSAYPPAPAPSTAYGAYYDRAEQALPSRDELRTLFIAGLPADAKPREVYNLFRDFPGYVSSHLRTGKSSQAYAFAVFADQPSALAALTATNGMVFDLEKNCSLHVDLAKSNSRSKRLRSDDASPYSPEKRTKRPMGFPDSVTQALSLVLLSGSCAGFVKLKMQNKLGAPVAFVDFKDANSSTEALNRLQGVVLYSSPGEGIRLEYAKSRMGLRKRDKHP
ncbi:serine/arginine-rich splicing factor SR34B-like isoform X3 [Panicum virgatum]|uniref:serine/arginine-rich splicing factor SR34B-like isoform X3 n=1 Tax=Panicum virgatum TaxID=38727 RepID=UPI0019D566EA|nr:serine/arginine-rich splicing factor SR34B-like isoform X3 [Panicum virgatum]